MKNYFCLIAILVGIFTSCSNDDIQIEKKISIVDNALTITVDLSNFYSSYTFDDTKHNIDQIAEAFRTFNSENNMHIQVRTLIYDKASELLVDSIVNYVTNTNSITESFNLYPGNYYAVTTLSFATKDKKPLWNVIDRDKISTAKLEPLNRYSKWSILSESTEEFSVSRDQYARINTIPKPLGALVYLYFQNFQYIDEDTYGDVADNKIRQLAFYTQRRADSYNIDPAATSKYNYAEETGSHSWYFNLYLKPEFFNDSWTYFETNLYSYCYILEPEQLTCFGYMKDGETTFHKYGDQTTNYISGKTYLAYWDYFKVGNPYLGIADNNHWNDYKVTKLFKTPYTEWGNSKSKVKEQMSLDNYSLLEETDNYLQYYGRFKELYSAYNFSSSDKLSFVDIVFDSSVSIKEITDYVNKYEDAKYYSTSDDGSTVWYLTNDGKSAIGIAPIDLGEGLVINFVEYVDNTGASLAKSKLKKSLQEKTLEIKSKINK